jgi:hypothetical protein
MVPDHIMSWEDSGMSSRMGGRELTSIALLSRLSLCRRSRGRVIGTTPRRWVSLLERFVSDNLANFFLYIICLASSSASLPCFERFSCRTIIITNCLLHTGFRSEMRQVFLSIYSDFLASALNFPKKMCIGSSPCFNTFNS